MYDVIIPHIDDAGLMDDVKIFFFCYMMDEGDFSPLQLPHYSYRHLYGRSWNMKGDEAKFVSRQVPPGKIRRE